MKVCCKIFTERSHTSERLINEFLEHVEFVSALTLTEEGTDYLYIFYEEKE